MSDNEHGPTQDQMEFTNVPDEIFEHHIWKHFSFDTWIRVFSLVCKKWKRICEESTVDPKQIRIAYKNSHDGGKLLKIVHKYQPTILRVNLEYMEDLFFVHWLCKASKRLHTLVLFKHSDPQFYFKMDVDPFDMYVKPIKNITTLAVKIEGSENFWQNLQIIFPNLKRLQVEHPNQLFNSNAEHFTLIHYDEIIRENLKVLDPDVRVCKHDNLIVTKLLGSNSKIQELTYKEYFQYFGETKLLTALKEKNCDEAKEILESGETSMEYEEALYESYDCYQYPSPISGLLFDQQKYWSTCVDWQLGYDTFVSTNIIPMPDSEKFIALSRFKRIKEALRVLSKLDDEALASASVKIAFFQNFLPHATKTQIHQKRVIKNAEKIIQSISSTYIREKDFGKIVDLRDWSDHFASTVNDRICCVMAAAGCQIPIQEFRQLGMQLDVGFIIEVIAKQHPANLFDALLYYPLDKLKGVATKINIDFTIEKDGDSLFNKRMQLHVSTEEELIEYKHLVNHMDSGRTPLLITIEHPHKPAWDTVKKLLELGADPTKHRGDKLSPLGLLLAKGIGHRNMYTYDVINITNLLVEYGADINAPCLYQERMCSPLMIAVLNGSSNDIIIRLIILGARTDYVDETGRTIMDAVINCQVFFIKESREIIKTLRSTN